MNPLTEAYVSGIFAKDTERMLKIFREWPVPLTFCINILYVETSTERILVDSGGGQADKDLPGRLLDNLSAAGITPQTIDTVIISHFHLDHIWSIFVTAQPVHIELDFGRTLTPRARAG